MLGTVDDDSGSTVYANFSPRSVTSVGCTQLIVTPSVNGNVFVHPSTRMTRTFPSRSAFTMSPPPHSRPSDGLKISASFPGAAFHIPAVGPASDRFAGEPDMCTHSVRFSVIVVAGFPDGCIRFISWLLMLLPLRRGGAPRLNIRFAPAFRRFAPRGPYLSPHPAAPGRMQVNAPAALLRVVQVTVSARLTAALVAVLPSFFARAAVSVGAAVLAVGSCRLLSAPLPAATLAADLALAVATSTLLQAVAAPAGGVGLVLGLAHCCMLLEVGQALPLGHLGDAFLANTQFIFAQSVGQLLVLSLAPALAFIAACALALGAPWCAARDGALATALTQAAVFVLRAFLVRSIPPSLQLPTVAVLLAVSRPLSETLAFAEPLHSFALFQAGEVLKGSLTALCSPLVAAMATLALVAAAPLLDAQMGGTMGDAAQMAAVSACTDLAVRAVAPVADTDPLLSLLPLLVFAAVLGGPKKGDANPTGPAPAPA
jgi:hypothetical protein